MQRHKKLYGLSVLLAVGVGGLSGFLSRNGMKEYASLKRPPLSPPGAVFPVVWTILFILMGIGAAMVWLTRRTERVRALAVYGIQLAVNFFWSILFFREGMRLLAPASLLFLAVLCGIPESGCVVAEPVDGNILGKCAGVGRRLNGRNR